MILKIATLLSSPAISHLSLPALHSSGWFEESQTRKDNDNRPFAAMNAV